MESLAECLICLKDDGILQDFLLKLFCCCPIFKERISLQDVDPNRKIKRVCFAHTLKPKSIWPDLKALSLRVCVK